MAEKIEKSNLPAYMPYGTFINFINGLRETGVPSKIDRSLMPNASGSLVSALIGSLKFLNLISSDGRPTAKMQHLVDSEGDERKGAFKAIFEDSYPFLTKTETFDLTKATTAEVAERFRSQDITGSTVGKGITFLIGLAKGADVKLSPHLKPPAPARNGKKPSKKREALVADVEVDEPTGGVPMGMVGFVKISIPLHGMEDGAVYLPDGMTKSQWSYALKITKFLIENYRPDDAPDGAEDIA